MAWSFPDTALLPDSDVVKKIKRKRGRPRKEEYLNRSKMGRPRTFPEGLNAGGGNRSKSISLSYVEWESLEELSVKIVPCGCSVNKIAQLFIREGLEKYKDLLPKGLKEDLQKQLEKSKYKLY